MPSGWSDAPIGGAGPPRFDRRALLAVLLGSVLAPLPAGFAQQMRLFRIATGGLAGTYYPVGTLIAAVIGRPPGGRPCGKGGSCGVPGLLALVQSSHGSVANVEAILAGQVESGFVQADVAWWAYRGEGPFSGRPPATELRAIAKLYNESVHLVAAATSGIDRVPDLAGRRVSLDEEGSGTLVDARLVLDAFGLSEDDLVVFHLKPGEAVGLMRRDGLDAFFVVAGYPTASVTEATRDLGARLIPIRGPEAADLVRRYPFFTYDLIPFDTYPGQPAVETIGVGALWVVRADLDEELVYGITQALFHPVSRAVLDRGHPRARDIRLETALEGVSIPLHPGAERYYREHGLLR